MYGIRITINGSIGWIVGKDSDVLLFPDKAAASTALKSLKETPHSVQAQKKVVE